MTVYSVAYGTSTGDWRALLTHPDDDTLLKAQAGGDPDGGATCRLHSAVQLVSTHHADLHLQARRLDHLLLARDHRCDDRVLDHLDHGLARVQRRRRLPTNTDRRVYSDDVVCRSNTDVRIQTSL